MDLGVSIMRKWFKELCKNHVKLVEFVFKAGHLGYFAAVAIEGHGVYAYMAGGMFLIVAAEWFADFAIE